MKKNKKLTIIGFILILVLGLALIIGSKLDPALAPIDNNSHKTGTMQIQVQPQTLNRGEPSEFSIIIKNPDHREIASVEAYIEYNPQVITIPATNNQNLGSDALEFSPPFQDWTVLINQLVENKIKIVIYCNPVGLDSQCQAFTDPESTFATIKFIATGKSGTQTSLDFVDQPSQSLTNTLGVLNPVENIVDKKIGDQISIK